MEKEDILRFIKGQNKKHGKNFSVQLKYMTENNKIRKRYGDFEDLIEDNELCLYNSDKKTRGHYQIDRIKEIKKRPGTVGNKGT